MPRITDARCNSLLDGSFSNGEKNLFQPIIDNLLDHNRDPYLNLIDLEDYIYGARSR